MAALAMGDPQEWRFRRSEDVAGQEARDLLAAQTTSLLIQPVFSQRVRKLSHVNL